MTRRFTAVVLAGSRPGPDPIAALTGAPCKALAPVAGRAMVARVLDALMASDHVGRLVIVTNEAPALRANAELAAMMERDAIGLLPAQESPSASAAHALAALGDSLPLLITTADHALLDAGIVDAFAAAALALNEDAIAGIVADRLVDERYPHARRTRIRLGRERYCGANLFALMTPRSARATALWQHVEKDRKRPWRIAARIGPGALIQYATGRLTPARAAARLSKIADARLALVPIARAEAALDVDRPEDHALAEAILRAREESQGHHPSP